MSNATVLICLEILMNLYVWKNRAVFSSLRIHHNGDSIEIYG